MGKKSAKPFHVAVTGHRFIPDDANLHAAIRQVLRDILAVHIKPGVILYSALAEGSDQLVAKIALELKEIKLCVPLPMPVDTYLDDFDSEDGRISFRSLLLSATEVIALSNQDNQQNPYQSLGEFLVLKADLLIAVWNGDFNQKKGGTGEVIKAALEAGKPVYWIYSPNLKEAANNRLIKPKQIGDVEKNYQKM